MVKRFFFLLLVLGIKSLVLSVPATLAANEFQTSYSVRYQVQPNGTINVNQDVALTNKLSSVYATQYALTIQSGSIQNIKASDDNGPLKIGTSKTPEKTIINLTFNQQVVGTGKTLNFNLNYDVLNLAQKNGEVWEIFVPKLANAEEIDDYNLDLAVPVNFGNPAFINPEPTGRQTEGNFNLYRFTKNQLTASGISAAFGNFQVFDFVLSYHLENPNLFLGETEIALPPDTAFQRVFYQKIEPAPLDVRVDVDGNWLAKYRLSSNEKLNITVVGKVKIFAQPLLHQIPENLNNNLKPQKYWEVDNPVIQAKAKELKTPRAIYDFVVKTLDYDFSRVQKEVERLGAVTALKNPQNAICMEFTDLFVALARAAGIPAREVNGYAYTTNAKLQPLSLVADVLHAWPEYWDKERKAWIPIDPTWGKTTGGINYFDKTDLNHFTFAIHGENSEQPYPAGSYRTSSTFGKDVQVVFGRYSTEDSPKLEAEFKLPQQIFSGFATNGELVIKNSGQQALYNLDLNFKPENVVLLLPGQKIRLAILPPFASRQFSLKIQPSDFLSFGEGKIKVLTNNQEFTTSVKIGSLFWQLILPVVGVILLVVLLVVFMLKRKRQSKHDH